MTQKTTELVSSGITDTGSKTTPAFLCNQNSSQRAWNPPKTKQSCISSYYSGHMWTAKKALELSKIYQENVQCKIENWKQSTPNLSFFRPYIKNENASPPKTVLEGEPTSSNSGTMPGQYNGNSGTEDNGVNIAGSDDNCSQTLLIVHQEK